jgi:hypothetical protein
VETVEHAEMVEKGRSQKGDVNPDEEVWKESVRHYNAQRREEMRAAWFSYHAGKAARDHRTLEGLIAHHEEQTARLCED